MEEPKECRIYHGESCPDKCAIGCRRLFEADRDRRMLLYLVGALLGINMGFILWLGLALR